MCDYIVISRLGYSINDNHLLFTAIFTYADGSRVNIALIRLCDPVSVRFCLSVC